MPALLDDDFADDAIDVVGCVVSVCGDIKPAHFFISIFYLMF